MLQNDVFIFQEPEKQWGKIHLPNLEKTVTEIIEYKGKINKKISKPQKNLLYTFLPEGKWPEKQEYTY